MNVSTLWPSMRTAMGTFNVKGWMARARESRRALPQRQAILQVVGKHKLDLFALQQTRVATTRLQLTVVVVTETRV